jgi:hypothetical protein
MLPSGIPTVVVLTFPASANNTEIATSTYPLVSAESGALQRAPLKPHGLIFVDAPDRIPSNTGTRSTLPIRENRRWRNPELIDGLIRGNCQ